jgi:hypothetical protein
MEDSRVTKKKKIKSNFKVMMSVFVDIRGIINIDCVPEGQTVNQVYYKEVSATLHDRVRRINLKCGRTAHGFFTMTTRRHTTHCLSRRFWRNRRSPCWSIHPTHLP